MDLEIVEADEQGLAEYASVPSTVRVAEHLVRPSSTPGAPGPLTAAAVAVPYDKDYDAPPARSVRDSCVIAAVYRWHCDRCGSYSGCYNVFSDARRPSWRPSPAT